MRLRVRLFLHFVVFVFAFLSISLPSPAQSTATVSGRVTDRSGAAIAGAEISAESLNGGAKQQAKSAADGAYSLTLAPERFRIRVTSPQMAPVEQERSEERRVGKECRARWWTDRNKKK